MSSPSKKPVGFSPHLGWCRVTERPWSHNAATTTSTSTAPSSRLQAAVAQPTPSVQLPPFYLCAEPGTRPPQLPHDSPSGALDKVSKVWLVSDARSVVALQYMSFLNPRVSTPRRVFSGLRTFVATFLTFTCYTGIPQHLIFLWLPSCLLYTLKIHGLFIISGWIEPPKKARGQLCRLALAEVN